MNFPRKKLLRPMANPPKPFAYGENVVSFEYCPDCNGRGWFLIQPFMTGGGDGSGGYRNKTQCPTCKSASNHYEQFGCLPKDIEAAIEQKEPQP